MSDHYRASKKWPKGGPHPGRMHMTYYKTKKGVERINVLVGMEQALAIAAGDTEAALALLEAVESKVLRVETGKVSK